MLMLVIDALSETVAKNEHVLSFIISLALPPVLTGV